MIFGEINAAVSLTERLAKLGQPFWRRRKESVADRFLRIFEAHGVHRTQIPRFLGHGVTLRAVESPELLTDLLTEEVLRSACQMFGVNREWLDGRESVVHHVHDFYKNPKGFESFLDELIQHSKDRDVESLDAVLLSPSSGKKHNDALLILEQPAGTLETRVISRFHLVSCNSFRYWRARGYLAAMCAALWRREIYVFGREMPGGEIAQLASGEVLLGWGGDGVHSLGDRPNWYAEDMALLPEAFLDGVNPERDMFGHRAGLKLWLELQERGAMTTGVEKGGERAAFQSALDTLNARFS